MKTKDATRMVCDVLNLLEDAGFKVKFNEDRTINIKKIKKRGKVGY